MKKILWLLLLCHFHTILAQNPIVPNIGLNDPHIHIFNDTASHSQAVGQLMQDIKMGSIIGISQKKISNQAS